MPHTGSLISGASAVGAGCCAGWEWAEWSWPSWFFIRVLRRKPCAWCHGRRRQCCGPGKPAIGSCWTTRGRAPFLEAAPSTAARNGGITGPMQELTDTGPHRQAAGNRYELHEFASTFPWHGTEGTPGAGRRACERSRPYCRRAPWWRCVPAPAHNSFRPRKRGLWFRVSFSPAGRRALLQAIRTVNARLAPPARPRKAVALAPASTGGCPSAASS